MINIFFSFWRKTSWIFVVLTLFFVYVGLPESVAVQHNEAGRPMKFLDKQNFIYIAGGLLLGINVLLGLVRSSVGKVNFQNKQTGNAWLDTEGALTKLVSAWSDAFLACINTYAVFALFALRSINTDVQQSLDRDYTAMIIFGAILLFVLIFALPIRFFFTKPSADF